MNYSSKINLDNTIRKGRALCNNCKATCNNLCAVGCGGACEGTCTGNCLNRSR